MSPWRCNHRSSSSGIQDRSCHRPFSFHRSTRMIRLPSPYRPGKAHWLRLSPQLDDVRSRFPACCGSMPTRRRPFCRPSSHLASFPPLLRPGSTLHSPHHRRRNRIRSFPELAVRVGWCNRRRRPWA
ncbi:hypothetical protein PMAYCL1PPCAC_22251, partial [Pristionchus mayeri]